MKWDGDFEFTLDDVTLLRAIQVVDSGREGHPCRDNLDHTIQIYVLDKPGFTIVRENAHLRSLLRAFLEANVNVAEVKQKLLVEQQRGFLGRFFNRKEKRNLEAQIKDLEVPRDEAFNKYEMLRRLTDWENTLLKRRKA